MKQLFFLFTVLFSLQLFSQKVITEKINSKEFNKDRIVKIYIPKDYDKEEAMSYPVAIVLGDGYLFDLYVGNAKLYANVDKAPKQIVVGIGMKNSYNKDVSIIPSNNALTSHSTKFFNFIQKELIPHMEGNYRTSPFMTIVGQGIGGNFITHFLKAQEPIFNSFICITPNFSELAANTIASYSLGRLASVDNSYFFYASNNKKYIRKEVDDRYNQIATYLSSFEAKNLHFTFNEFKDAPNHLSVISETIPRAFDKMFSIYSKITKDEFDNNIKDLGPLEAIKYVEQKYLDIEYLYGTNLNVRLDDIFAIEGIVIDKLDGDYLRVLGDFVMIKYPNSHIGDFYVGKYYELGKDYEKADFYYKAAYGKMDPSDPNANAFYENIKRVNDLKDSQPKEAPLEELPEEDQENEDKQEDDKQ